MSEWITNLAYFPSYANVQPKLKWFSFRTKQPGKVIGFLLDCLLWILVFNQLIENPPQTPFILLWKMENISVCLSIFDGTLVNLEVSPSLTVGQMKEMILQLRHLRLQREEARNLVVVFAGKALQDDRRLQVRWVVAIISDNRVPVN